MTFPMDHVSLWLGATGLFLWGISVMRADFSRMAPLGLVTVLGWTYFVGLAILAAALAIELLHVPLRSGRLLFLIIAYRRRPLRHRLGH